MNRDYDARDKINPYYVPLGNYYGNRDVNTDFSYRGVPGVQIVPIFAGVNYDKPNYNSLVHGSCVDHAQASNAYIYKDCVTYKARFDGPNGVYYRAPPQGATGTVENYYAAKPTNKAKPKK